MDEAINYLIGNIFKNILEKPADEFKCWFLNQYHKKSEFGVVEDTKQVVLDTLNQLNCFDKEKFEIYETTISEIERFYNVINNLPKTYKIIIYDFLYNGNPEFDKCIDFISAAIKQHEKGFNKYGKTIDDCPLDTYNWQKEAQEEEIDKLVYKQKGKEFKEWNTNLH